MIKLICVALALSIGAASAQPPTPGNPIILQTLGPDQFQFNQRQPFQLNWDAPLPIGILVPVELPSGTPPKMQEGKGPPEKRDRAARPPQPINPINIWRDEIMPELKRKRMAD